MSPKYSSWHWKQVSDKLDAVRLPARLSEEMAGDIFREFGGRFVPKGQTIRWARNVAEHLLQGENNLVGDKCGHLI